MITALVASGRETELIDLRLVELAAGGRETMQVAGESCALVLEGEARVSVAGRPLGILARRGDVFDGPGDAAYVPPGHELELEGDSAALVAVAAASVEGVAPTAARVIPAGEQPRREAGRGNWSRTIRTVLGPEQEAGRLIVGETISPPGNWSSYPPHKHDRQSPPEEAALEEVYFYRFKPAGGFGIQLIYDDEDARALVVRDGDTVPIPSGYHPVVAAPGYALYYLWVMAGQGRELAQYFDPRHVWVQDAAE